MDTPRLEVGGIAWVTQPKRYPFDRARHPATRAAARKALTFSAVAVTLLPIPVTYFKILPAYPLHARFLLIYAPFLCLLTLSYLFYVRDSLARAMFADVLDPQAPPDSYYHLSGRAARALVSPP